MAMIELEESDIYEGVSTGNPTWGCEHRLWILSRKKGTEVVYALGRTSQEAWANAIMIIYGDDEDEVRAEHLKTSMRKNGWKAKQIRFRVSAS